MDSYQAIPSQNRRAPFFGILSRGSWTGAKCLQLLVVEKKFLIRLDWPYESLLSWSRLKEQNKHPKKSNTRIFFCPPLAHPLRILCVCIFLHFKEKTQPEHKEFRRSKAPKKVNSGMEFLVKSLCLGVFFGLEECHVWHLTKLLTISETFFIFLRKKPCLCATFC